MICASTSVHGPLIATAAETIHGGFVVLKDPSSYGYGDVTIHFPTLAHAEAVAVAINAAWPSEASE